MTSSFRHFRQAVQRNGKICVSRLIDMPQPRVAAIYRDGQRWPMSLNDFDRVARRDVEALRCSLDEASQLAPKR